MYKGSKIVPVRIPARLLADVEAAIASANRKRFQEPYTMSSWLIDCIRDRLAKLSHAKMSRLRGQLKRRQAKCNTLMPAEV